jgi:RND family efflux transporter MFP subunit
MASVFASAASTPRQTDRSTGSMRWMPCAAAVVLLGATLSGCNSASSEQEPTTLLAARPVQVAEVREQAVSEPLRLPAALRSARRARPAFLHSGYLAERPVELGRQVAAGDLLATLHNPSLQPGVQAAEAAVREAREQLAQLDRETLRLAELRERRVVAEDELERTRSRRDAAREALGSAEARLGEARDQLAESRLRAPFAGVIMDVHVEPGDFVAAGQPVLELADPGRLELRLEMPAARAETLLIGTPITVQRSADGRAAQGVVREIGGALPGRSRPVIVELQPTPGWLPGESVYALLEGAGERALFVPLAAIVNPGTSINRVFRINARQQVEAVQIELGTLADGWVAIQGPLEAGDRVVIAGQSMLLEGEAVRVLQ